MSRADNPLIRRIPIKNRSGDVVGEVEVVAYRGLLDMVHRDGLRSLRTTLIQIPSKENGETAIVSAEIVTGKGTFTGIGDANPGNVNPRIAPHIIRMAETRAEARAMRKAVNIGVVALEELMDDVDTEGTRDGTMQPVGDARRPVAPANEDAPVNDSAPSASPQRRPPSGSKATDEQRRYVYRLLSERGIEGEAIKTYLERELGVPAVIDASKSAVSALIDRLKNGPSNGHAQTGRN